jgi:threonylcarbamoyladenosine tRNA methylthiotransferase MtaB
VVLTGINLGRYRDAGSGAGLPEVVSAVAATGIRRIRLSSIEPGDLTPDLLAVLASTPAVCEHLHVPLQSGSDRVLEAMGRPYTVAEYGERIERARAALPGLALTTDVITGFPGESDAEAAEALATIGEFGFSRLHVFRFSPRDGTVAAGMAGRLGPAVIAERARELRALDARARAAFAAARIGTTVEVLVERVTREGGGTMIASGTTREYLTLTCAAGGRSAGDISVARAVSLDGVSLRGEWA